MMNNSHMENMPTGPEAGNNLSENTHEKQEVNQFETANENREEELFENPAEDPLIIDTEERIASAANERLNNAQEEPGDAPEETKWKRAYEEESVKQWNKFEEENPDRAKKYREEKEKWYEKARGKAREVMRELDPNYEVIVQDSIVSPDDNDKAEYRTVTLAFKSPKGPDFSWTMEIEPTNDYVQNRLSDVIKKIYERKQEGVSEKNIGKRNVEGMQNIKFDFFPTKDERYLAGELERLEKLEQIREDLGAPEKDDNELLRQILLKIGSSKRFVMGRGTLRQQTLEVVINNGEASLVDKVARGNQRRTWTLDKSGGVIGSERGSYPELKALLKEFKEQIASKTEHGDVFARPSNI